jgi:uncharacterized protein DUF3551
MRIPALAILTTAAVLTATPLRAQTYDPRYPVCLQSYHIGGGRIDCRFFSIDQCNRSIPGGAGQCLTNPYFAGGPPPREPPYGWWDPRRYN